MCRYDDDDYSWYVESEEVWVELGKPCQCEDCCRTIEVGEFHWRYTGMPSEDSEWDERPMVFSVRYRIKTADGRIKFGPMIYLDDEDMADVFEALGFDTEEDRDDRVAIEPEYHRQCLQCYIANEWLKQVCHQHTVMVTREDLIQHTHEYDPITLGIHFMALAEAARHQWIDFYGHLMEPKVVLDLTERAVRHAREKGLIHA